MHSIGVKRRGFITLLGGARKNVNTAIFFWKSVRL
jgi:hypothetical protein